MSTDTAPLVIDTTKALKALVDEIGGSYRECARIMGCGHTHLWGVLNGKRPPTTLDTLVRYAARAQTEAGISMSVLVTHDQQVRYQIKAA